MNAHVPLDIDHNPVLVPKIAILATATAIKATTITVGTQRKAASTKDARTITVVTTMDTARAAEEGL